MVIFHSYVKLPEGKVMAFLMGFLGLPRSFKNIWLDMANGPTKLSLFLDISNLNCFTIPEMDVNDFEPQTNTGGR